MKRKTVHLPLEESTGGVGKLDPRLKLLEDRRVKQALLCLVEKVEAVESCSIREEVEEAVEMIECCVDSRLTATVHSVDC